MKAPAFARLWHSLAFRLALTCGGLVAGSVLVLSSVFYLGTIGVMTHGADTRLRGIADRLAAFAGTFGLSDLAFRVGQTLSDGVNSDTEIFLLLDEKGERLAGNIASTPTLAGGGAGLFEQVVMRDGRESRARLTTRALDGGGLLVVGRDMSDLYEIESVIWRAIGAGSVLALLLAIAAVFMFRRKIESLIFDIRRTALEVEAGNLSRRIPIASAGDEFSRLGEDINRMLDRIEHLMDGVRHVSNVIAHNLKTPLARIRNRIDAARMGRGNGQAATTELTGAADFAIEHIDGLIVVFDKLLQIAQAESDTRRRPFESVDLVRLAADVVDLYAAVAEEQGIELVAELDASARISGDPDLLASALTNLLDNALVHAPGSPRIVVSVHVRDAARRIELAVTDQGPGIDDAHKGQVLERFFRLDRERPGSGLGLSIVSAIAHLHGAGLALEDARPGLRVRLSFPLPGGDLAES